MHIAIIMDGNGRWGIEHGLDRAAGHHRGADAVRRTVEAAARRDVAVLTLYAFSSDNWKRPEAEVAALMSLFTTFLDEEQPRCLAEGIAVEVIGRRDRLSPAICAQIDRIETTTSAGSRLRLRLAIDYSSRDLLVRAAEEMRIATRDDFQRALHRVMHARTNSPDVDLLIRTGREKRISDFLLWESAYAELVFTDVLWPDFTAADLDSAIAAFHARQRRFGAIPSKELTHV